MNTVYRVTANFLLPWGDTAKWVWHYQSSVASGNLNVQLIDAILALLIIIWDYLKSRIDSDVQGTELELAVYDAVDNEFNTILTRSLASLVGEAVGDGEPGNVSPFMTFPTSLAKSRGKKKLFSIVDSDITNGALSAALVAAMVLAGTAWSTTVTTTNAEYFPGNFNRPSVTFRPWDNSTVSVGAFSGSQYSRLPGRGV